MRSLKLSWLIFSVAAASSDWRPLNVFSTEFLILSNVCSLSLNARLICNSMPSARSAFNRHGHDLVEVSPKGLSRPCPHWQRSLSPCREALAKLEGAGQVKITPRVRILIGSRVAQGCQQAALLPQPARGRPSRHDSVLQLPSGSCLRQSPPWAFNTTASDAAHVAQVVPCGFDGRQWM